jgi:ABC-type transporter Mla maintaining outer membrane lipid asymmetry ATPase subunit MlaF
VAEGLVLTNVSYRRGRIAILDRQSLTVPRGGTFVVTGPNGSGKSTLLHLCAGLIAPDQGDVRIGGHATDALHPSELVRRGVRRGFVFQQGGLVANLSALHNVGLPLRYHADVLSLSEEIIDDRARFCLGAVGVESPSIHALPGRLSFGIAKRVAFARAMAIEPNFAFFDDPDAGLDRENAEVVHEILVSYRNDPDVTMVIATNHRALIERLGGPVHELLNGRLLRQDLLTMPPSSLV